MSKVIKALRIVSKCSKRAKIEIRSKVSYFNGDFTFSMRLQESQYLGAEYQTVDEVELAFPGDAIDSDIMPVEFGHHLPRFGAHDLGNLAWCALATDVESMRHSLGGVKLESDCMVATDGRRLHMSKQNAQLPIGETDNVIIPASAIKALLALVKLFRENEVTIEIKKNSIVFGGMFFTFETRLIEGRFPNWRQVLPTTTNYDRSKYDAKLLVTECKGLLKACDLGNKVEYARTPVAERKRFCEKPAIREFSKVKLDARYLAQACDQSDIVDIWTKTKDYPVQITYNERLAVVMPMNR